MDRVSRCLHLTTTYQITHIRPHHCLPTSRIINTDEARTGTENMTQLILIENGANDLGKHPTDSLGYPPLIRPTSNLKFNQTTQREQLPRAHVGDTPLCTSSSYVSSASSASSFLFLPLHIQTHHHRHHRSHCQSHVPAPLDCHVPEAYIS